MQIILIPGMWLDASSWDKVTPILEAAGHTTQPMTLPGLESVGSDRSEITLADHVAAVVDVIDSVGGDVVLVGHSAGAGLAYAAVDARPERVARAIYIGGFPSAHGQPNAGGYPAVNGEVPFPDWSDFDESDLADLDEAGLAAFRAMAIPTPARAVSDPQQLSNEQRYKVPTTMICPEFSAEMLQDWIAQGMEPVIEFTRIENVEYVDLPTGHWPQFTKPEELAAVILESIDGTGGG
ncbi:MAG TPA: alpha/beta hydrolase [Acidimicrobiia bacterium]